MITVFAISSTGALESLGSLGGIPTAASGLAARYSQNYYELNKNQPYRQLVITPKLRKAGPGE